MQAFQTNHKVRSFKQARKVMVCARNAVALRSRWKVRTSKLKVTMRTIEGKRAAGDLRTNDHTDYISHAASRRAAKDAI